MAKLLKFFIAAAFAWLGGCVSYPYTSRFADCDADAGACYRSCESYAEDGRDYSACHADCEIEADRCFADAYGPYHYAGSAYGPANVSPWYGRYGSWYPNSGYVFSLGVVSGYGHRPRAHGRDHRSYRGRRGRYDGVPGGSPPPPSAPPAGSPTPPPQVAQPPGPPPVANPPRRRDPAARRNAPRTVTPGSKDKVPRQPD